MNVNYNLQEDLKDDFSSIYLFYIRSHYFWKFTLFLSLDRSTIKRSLSDGNIVCESDTTRNMDDSNSGNLSEKADDQCLSESDPDIFSCGSDICQYRYA